MAKITQYQLDSNGKKILDTDGKKVVQRVMDIPFLQIGEMEDLVLKNEIPENLLKIVAGYFRQSATIDLQDPSRKMLCELTEDGENKFSTDEIFAWCETASLVEVNSRGFDAVKSAAKFAPTIAKISNEILADHGMQRVTEEEMQLLRDSREKAAVLQAKADAVEVKEKAKAEKEKAKAVNG